MRNVILLLPAILFVGAAASQITITGDDMPQPDVTYPLVNAAILDLSLGEISGANATWDASDLTALMDAPLTPVDINDASISAALVFNSPFNSAYQCDFYLPTELPDFGVDLGIPLEGFNNFYQTDGDAYAIAGVGLSAMGFDLPVTYDDIDEIIPLPLEYGETLSSTAAFQLDLTGIFTYGLSQSREVEVDGWGTLILPSGSYEVLRTRTELTATDDIFIEQLGEPFSIDREQATYQWWGAGMGFPFARNHGNFWIAPDRYVPRFGRVERCSQRTCSQLLHAVSQPRSARTATAMGNANRVDIYRWSRPSCGKWSVQCLHGTE